MNAPLTQDEIIELIVHRIAELDRMRVAQGPASPPGNDIQRYKAEAKVIKVLVQSGRERLEYYRRQSSKYATPTEPLFTFQFIGGIDIGKG